MQIFTASAVLAAFLLLPGLVVGPSLDAAAFSQVASDVRHGATLYVSAWDHKPPATYVVLAAAQAALPLVRPWLITWVLSLLATAATATLVAGAVLRCGLPRRTAFIVALMVTLAMAAYPLALGGGLTETFAAVPLAGSLNLSLTATAGSRPLRRAAGMGFLMAMAAMFSLQAVPGAAAVAIVGMGPARPRLDYARMTVALLLGAAIPVVAAVAWLATQGALSGAVDALVAYPAAYRGVNAALGAAISTPVIAWTVLSLLFLIVPALTGTIAAAATEIPRRAVRISLVWVALSVAYLFLQGRFIAHYAILLAIPLGVLAAFSVDRLVVRLRLASGWTRRALLTAPFVLVATISAAAIIASGAMEIRPIAQDGQRSSAVAAAIQLSTDGEDSIWVWGNEPEIYLDSERAVAGPYSFLYPLVTPGYTTPQMIASTLETLEANRPSVVVDAGSDAPGEAGFQPLLVPRPVASDGRDLDILDPLRQFVADHYSVATTVDGWILYALDRP